MKRLPAEKIALFTCMDTRLVEFLEPAMGIRRGAAQVIDQRIRGAFHDPVGKVLSVARKIRESPLLPRDIPVHGLILIRIPSAGGSLPMVRSDGSLLNRRALPG